jgi:serine/threonine protein kinase
MAEIWLARATGIEGFEKLVVVKKLLPRIEHDATLVSMFLDEARVAATLHHPNVVQVYDIGIGAGNDYYFSMEFVYGQDLSHLLRRAAAARKPVSLDTALTIILGMCAGLHYAHEKEGADGKPLKLVHRDVSPQNVLISYDGAVKIMDFGIAKATSNSQVTRDGTLKGKISYMSPEQGVSGTLDRRSDLFSLAIMLWELTTFRRLFKASSDFETLRRIIQEDVPPPSKYRPDCPPELERIIMKGLRRKPEERYQTGEEMQLDLEAFAREQRLVISSVSLSRYIRDLFSDRVTAWAQAQAAGRTFTDFLVDTPSLKEGTSVTADTWIAPSTEPTSTAAHAAELDLVLADLPEIPDFDDRNDEPAYPKVPAKRRWPIVAMLAVVGVCAAAFVAWRQLGSTDAAAGADVPSRPAISATPATPATPAPPAPPATPATPATPTTTGAASTGATTTTSTSTSPVVTPDTSATETPATTSKRVPTTTTKPIVRVKPTDRSKITKPVTPAKPVKKEDLDSPFPD